VEQLERVRPDYILCDGDPASAVLSRFPGKVFAIHDRVQDAIVAGDRDTCAAVHLTAADGTRGALFLLGPRYPIAPMALDARKRGDAEFLYRYAELHRQWMRGTSWGPIFARAIELLAGGTMSIVGDVVWIDGAPAPCRMGEAPDACYEPEAMLARGIPRSCPFIG
jgi:hypothetical protein